MNKMLKIIKNTTLAILFIATWATLYLFFYSVDASAQQAPDVVVNAESSQGNTIENQDFNNLYQQQSISSNIVTVLQNYFNGITSVPNGSLLAWNATNVGIGTFGQGSTNQELISQGANVAPIWGTSPSRIQFFTTSGTFTAPSSVTYIYLTECAGGAGGGGTTTGTNSEGGGGGGQCIENFPYAVTAGNTYSFTIGAGSNGGNTSGSNGVNGGNSSFNSGAITLLGGIGGLGSTNGNGANNGSLGGGVVNGSGNNASASVSTASAVGGAAGIPGGNGAKGNTVSNASGAGGGCAFGSGAAGVSSESAGNSASGFCGGGSGANSVGSSSHIGGAGAQGFLLIAY